MKFLSNVGFLLIISVLLMGCIHAGKEAGFQYKGNTGIWDDSTTIYQARFCEGEEVLENEVWVCKGKTIYQYHASQNPGVVRGAFSIGAMPAGVGFGLANMPAAKTSVNQQGSSATGGSAMAAPSFNQSIQNINKGGMPHRRH